MSSPVGGDVDLAGRRCRSCRRARSDRWPGRSASACGGAVDRHGLLGEEGEVAAEHVAGEVDLGVEVTLPPASKSKLVAAAVALADREHRAVHRDVARRPRSRRCRRRRRPSRSRCRCSQRPAPFSSMRPPMTSCRRRRSRRRRRRRPRSRRCEPFARMLPARLMLPPAIALSVAAVADARGAHVDMPCAVVVMVVAGDEVDVAARCSRRPWPRAACRTRSSRGSRRA